MRPTADELAAAGLRVAQDGPVLTLTLDRPEVRNAQTPALWRALAAVGASLDVGTRVVVLRGAGESFSAGLDRRMLSPDGIPGELGFLELAAMPDADADAAIAGYQEAFTWWRQPQFVSVAAVQGHAVGAGFQLALACDLRVVADDATFCMRETALGLVPDLGGTQPLVDAVGYGRALEICATSRRVGAQEAVAIGLATAVVPRADLDAASLDLAAALSAAPAGAVEALKSLLQQAAGHTYAEQCAAERSAQLARIRTLSRPPPPR